MNRRRLGKIAKELEALRRNPNGIKPSQLERLAGKLGRRKVNRGSEPNYRSPEIPDLGHPLSIPHHQTLKSGTARSIIFSLLSDVDLWGQYLDSVEEQAEPDADGDQEDDETLDDDDQTTE
jgi:hypothetical protein